MPTADEWDLIERIRRRAAPAAAVPVGIGDDAAVIAGSIDGSQWLVTTDVLMEGVHFDLSSATAEQVGHKALAVNLSDIAAMAGRPTVAFVGLVLPRARGASFADDVMDGVFSLAEKYDVSIAGGDTNIWDGPAVISVTLLGEPTGRGPVTRSGARVGDWLLVTGALGGSLGGRHLTFTSRIREAVLLNSTVDVHAMIDLSDGLASDVQHVLEQSSVGAIIDPGAIPIHADVDPALPDAERREHALADGEDFELLFCVSPAEGQLLLDRPLFETPVTKIGHIIDEAGCWLQGDTEGRIPLERTGWQHRFDA